MIIVVCASVDFYEQVNDLAGQLEAQGHVVVVPATALKMKQSGNYKTSDYKTWYKNKNDYSIKKALMDAHFDAIRSGDAILVVNNDKKGIAGYIGGNVLMEMSLAYFDAKPIFVLNDLADQHPFYEEVIGMGATLLHGDLANIK